MAVMIFSDLDEPQKSVNGVKEHGVPQKLGIPDYIGSIMTIKEMRYAYIIFDGTFFVTPPKIVFLNILYTKYSFGL